MGRQRYDDEWFTVPDRNHLVACCDCGLVHRIDYAIVRARGGGWTLRVRYRRMPGLTRRKRRQMRRP